ncbi:MAG: ATPase [Gammaproteobacteria bacterium]|nr:MAG: ATPase [Gammaproteobacteria bacterium]
MKVAIPVREEKLCIHFGHCDQFVLVEVNTEDKSIIGEEIIDAPPHEPGLLPRWLNEKNVAIIIAGGMGSRAQQLFQDKNIEVIVGAPVETPQNLVKSLLDKTLVSGANTCDH